jgi:hypothetical protein
MQNLELLEKRFWQKATILGPNDCWIWNAGRQTRGYGAFAYQPKRSVTAHRVAWAIKNANGELPDPSLVVMHSCDNKLCVNPNHLSLGTIEENNRDAREKGLTKSIETIVGFPILNKTCRHGHERTLENTVFRQKKGKPPYALCKLCLKEKDKRMYAKTPKEVRNRRMQEWRARKHTPPTTPSPLSLPPL